MVSMLYPALLQIVLAGGGGLQDAQTAAPPQQAVEEGYEAKLQRARSMATSGDEAQRAQALQLYAEMLEKAPGNSDVLLARGRLNAWMRNYPAAETDLLSVTHAKPEYADAWSALGDLYVWSDRPGLAVDAYGHWVKLAPNAPEPLLARGRALRSVGELVAGRADFARARALGANEAQVADLVSSTLPQLALPEALKDDGYRWSLRADFDHTSFSGGRDAWLDGGMAIRRKFERGSVGLEWLQANHFNRNGSAWALDSYVSLWSRAYANVRYLRGTSQGLFPRYSWRTEVFQGVGSGWELSASIDHLRFSSDTEFYGVGVGRYVGNWYLRYKLQHVPGVGSGSWSHRGVVRNYYRGNADDYFEVRAGTGRSTDLDHSGALIRNSNASFGVSWVRYFRPDWGVKIGAGYADDAGSFNERQLSLSLYHRW